MSQTIAQYHKDFDPLSNLSRFFAIGGITIEVESFLSNSPMRFSDSLESFAVLEKGVDVVHLRHEEGIPYIDEKTLGHKIYHRLPWIVYDNFGVFCYKKILPDCFNHAVERIGLFSKGHSEAIIYSSEQSLSKISENWGNSLSLFTTDQIWLSYLLAERNSLMLHSAAAIINGSGLVFVGPSGAGKSTIITLLQSAADKEMYAIDVLCDDRNIVRRFQDGWWVYGTHSHGDIPTVSPKRAPLRGIFFLEQSENNKLTLLKRKEEIIFHLMPRIVRTRLTSAIEKMIFTTTEQLLGEAEFYQLQFSRTGNIHRLLSNY